VTSIYFSEKVGSISQLIFCLLKDLDRSSGYLVSSWSQIPPKSLKNKIINTTLSGITTKMMPVT